MNIVLIGMRGSGKSTIAKLLSKKLGKPYYDMDVLLSENAGMPISEVVKRYGWEHFRNQESALAEEIAKKKNVVISTSGGIVTREENIAALKNSGKFIFLKTSVAVMLKRIGNSKSRPALTDKKTLKEEIKEIWKIRKSLYESSADITINTDNKTLSEITQEIVKQL